MIFSRKRAEDRRGATQPSSRAVEDVDDEVTDVDEYDDADGGYDDEDAAGGSGATSVTPWEGGPYDASEAPGGVERLDLGALQIPVVEGVEVRVQADPEGRVQHVVLVAGESALQLGVFAAPRTEPIWDEVRAEVRGQLRSDGFTSREVDGEYGVELCARVRTPEGMADIRFVGINGPRWLVRGIFQGTAAIDASTAPALLECLHGLVVVRGSEAMPAFEALPLRLPREIAEQAQQDAERSGAGEAPASPGDAADPSGPARPVTRRSARGRQ